jgi:hypothetical protein
MGTACSSCAGEEKWGNLREGHHLKSPSIDGRIILKWMFKK